MKKFLPGFMIVMLCALPVCAAPAMPAGAGKNSAPEKQAAASDSARGIPSGAIPAEVIEDKAFVRADHDNKSKRVATLEEGDYLDLLEEWRGAQDFPWYRVQTNDGEGWIYGQVIRRLDGGPAAAAQAPSTAGQGNSLPEAGILASDEDYVTVIAHGQGTDRAKALEQSWIEAVRLAVGAVISSTSELNNDEFAENTIAHSRGVLENFDIVGENNDGKRVTVAIQAKVRKEILTDVAQTYSEAQTVKADAGGAIKAQLDVKAQDSTTGDKQTSGVALLKEVLDAYGPEMFYSAELDPKIYFDEESKRSYVKILEKFNEDIFWKEFLPKLRSVLDGVAIKKEKKFYIQAVQRANQQLLKNGSARGLGLYFSGDFDVGDKNTAATICRIAGPLVKKRYPPRRIFSSPRHFRERACSPCHPRQQRILYRVLS